MMKGLFLCTLALAFVCAQSFSRGFTGVARSPLKAGSRSLSLVQAKKDAAVENDYWQGEWVCADCGYIYDVNECNGMFFEEQPRGFKCPQCRGPRRRFAKKVGERVGLTLDGGDGPILLFSFGGLALTVIFGIWAVGNL